MFDNSPVNILTEIKEVAEAAAERRQRAWSDHRRELDE